MEESWRPISKSPGYLISSTGKVKSPRGIIVKTKVGGKGYEYIRITGQLGGVGVHRLVAQAFIDNVFNHKEVNHKDGNKWNNNVENLEWCSRLHNIRHSIDSGLRPAILDPIQIKTIKSLLKTGELSRKQIGGYFKVSRHIIYNIAHGLIWSRI